MDVRYKAFLVREASAIHRQQMVRTAQATGAGMSGGRDLQNFITRLEIFESEAALKEDDKLVEQAIAKLRGK